MHASQAIMSLTLQRERFDQLVEFCTFPWILSNAEEKTKDGRWDTLKHLERYRIINRDLGPGLGSVKIGIIGLMSPDTISKTDASAAKTFKLKDMYSTGQHLAKELRSKPHNCDLVFALTHALFSQDVALGSKTLAYTKDRFHELSEKKQELKMVSGIDLIFGGHNHDYFIGSGVNHVYVTGPPNDLPNKWDRLWEDHGLLIVKSGTDFNDLSEVLVELEVSNGVDLKRKVVVKSVNVTRHHMPGWNLNEYESDSRLATMLNNLFEHQVLKPLKTPVARLSRTPQHLLPDMTTDIARQKESVIGNWIADSMVHWFRKHHPCNVIVPKDLIFIMTGGSIRTNSPFGSVIKQGDIIQLLPFDTSLVMCTMTGADIWGVIRAALAGSATYDVSASQSGPDQQKNTKTRTGSGKFPVVSGIRVTWDSKKDGQDRVKTIKLSSNPKSNVVDDKDHTYSVLTHQYLVNAGDGLKSFSNHKELVDTEVPMYKALLEHIRDLSAEDAAGVLVNTFVSPPVGGFPENRNIFSIIGYILSGLSARTQDSNTNDWQDSTNFLESVANPETMVDRVVEATQMRRLPILSFPTAVDNRMQDLALGT
ncbi:unnamed protein product [Rhizoctonia solani]|uniref:5'-Nucleotidase C-terminal domain-containing protein n=1 Tax=Rhizoctonia solani TaxID=456999 RepID=A0A8H2WGI9_9AGAM|nr:unnamed protein product [Rhizoctonia solani]